MAIIDHPIMVKNYWKISYNQLDSRVNVDDENLTLLRRMLACGVAPLEFNTHVQALNGPNQDRLIRVAKRLQMTHLIRYDLSYTQQPGMGVDYEYRIEHLELTSLEVYLLLTCLDTLSGPPEYYEIRHWFEATLADISYSKREILEKCEEYRENYGTRATIKSEFLNLPEAYQTWINQNVTILRSGDFPEDDIVQQNSERLLTNLFKYFYDVRRNEYTHSSTTRQTAVNWDPIEQFDGWSISSAGWDYLPDRSRQTNKFCLWYRNGLDEATILRVIIHGVILKILGIEPNAGTIEAYLNNERRRKIITGLIKELEGNANLLSWWRDFDGTNVSSNLKSYLYHVGIPSLHQGWTESFREVISDVNFERGYRTLIDGYLQALEFINTEIENFNQQHPPDHQSWEEKVADIVSFFQRLVGSIRYQTIVEMSDYSRIGNLQIIRRDPCYT